MPAVASRDTQRDATVEGLASQHRPGSAMTSGVGEKRGQVAAAPVRSGCERTMHPLGGKDSGRRCAGAEFFSVVVGVLRRVECQGGFRGVRRSGCWEPSPAWVLPQGGTK
jgi:hypothetical protein